MPLQIDEISITMQVGTAPPAPERAGNGATGRAGIDADRKAIVEECVRLVLKALADRGER